MQRLFCVTENRIFDVEKPVELGKYKCPGCGSNAVEDMSMPEQATDEKKKEIVQ